VSSCSKCESIFEGGRADEVTMMVEVGVVQAAGDSGLALTITTVTGVKLGIGGLEGGDSSWMT
jgi:hypothetical protein